MKLKYLTICVLALFCSYNVVLADNPLVTHIYTADPSARVFNDTLYIFPSHDIAETETSPGYNGFRMEDYHVFSTTDLMNFTDHGVILKDEDLNWVPNAKDAMWAPDCNFKNGKYYFYFPGDFKIGIATADHPTGPYTPVQESIKNANQIDPNCFIDDDGTPYLYFGGGDYLKVMRLKDDMFTPDMEPKKIESLQVENYKEGPWMFKRNGVYYFTYPVDLGGGEQIHYATGNNPLGPFTPQGTIMDAWSDGCWTNHHSILEYKGQWYIFYHHKDISGDQTLRSMCADKLFFNADGSIQKVTPTLRGIGIRDASDLIQMDRYSEKKDVSVSLLEDLEPLGWKVSEIKNGGWIKYKDVNFASKAYSKVLARVAASAGGGKIDVRLGSSTGQLVSTIDVPNTNGLSKWTTVSANISVLPSDTNDIVCVFKSSTNNTLTLNWIRFVLPATITVSKSGYGNGILKLNKSIICDENTSVVILPYSASEAYNFSFDTLPDNSFITWKKNGLSVDEISDIKAGDEIIAEFQFIAPPRLAGSIIEAEDYDEQLGVQVESCNEGGKNIGYIQNGDYILFRDIDFGIGVKKMKARVASGTNGGKINLFLDSKSGTPFTTLSLVSTGGWQSWTTVSKNIRKIEGSHDIYLEFVGGDDYLFNLNWITFQEISLAQQELSKNEDVGISVYPNPVSKTNDNLKIRLSGHENTPYQIFNALGKDVLSGTLTTGINSISISHLNAKSVYIITANKGAFIQMIQLLP